MVTAANIVALATAVPAHRLEQGRVLDRVEPMFAATAEFERLRPVFGNSGIAQRYSPMPFDWFDRPQGWPERNREYLTAALDLTERVGKRVLDLSDMSVDEIGAIVTVSTTGIATPSLDARLLDRLRLPSDVQRLPIFGLGCGGGAIGLARAATLAQAMPDKAVLLLVVELCSLWFRRHDLAKSSIVASALFGDGAAAVLLRCGETGPAIVAAGEHTWPDSLDVMGWDVAEDGLKPIFSRDIPRLVAAGLADAAGAFLAKRGLRLAEIDRFICHPGGPKVVTACEDAFGLDRGVLAEERNVLRDFGNMSAASVLFVLERALSQPRDRPWRRALLTALGPGFTAGFVLIENR